MSLKVDLEYHTLFGLTKREKLPLNDDKIDIDKAKELKIQMQERVMELWNHQDSSNTLDLKTHSVDTERLL